MLFDHGAVLVACIVQDEGDGQACVLGGKFVEQLADLHGGDVGVIANCGQFFVDGVQSAQHIEALAAGRRWDEQARKAPDKAQKGRQYKVRRIDEKNRAQAGDSLLQLRHQFLFQEILLNLRVCLGRDGSHLPWFHANLFEEFSNLGRFALNAGQPFDLRGRVRDSRWRILQKKFFRVP